MFARVQKTKSEFLKRKMLTGLSGKYNFISESFIRTDQMQLLSRVNFICMEKKPHWSNVSHFLKEIRILYPVKLSFRNEAEIKMFSDKQKLSQLVATWPALQEIMKGVLQVDMKGHWTVTQSHMKKQRFPVNVTKQANY